MRVQLCVVVVAAAVVLSGCGGSSAKTTATQATPTSTATPTYLCASPTGGAPKACSAASYSQQQAALARADQAKDVYTKATTELAALQRTGGVTEPSPALSAVAGGPYLSGQLTTLAKLAELGAKATGTVKITKLVGVEGAPVRGYEAAVFACVDSRATKVVQKGKTIATGRLIAETVFFKLDGDSLKAWDAEKADVLSC